MELHSTILKNISYTILYSPNGEKLFSPWFKTKDKFGGDTYVNEMTNRQGVVTPNIYRFGSYGTFIFDQESSYPAWFGYFDNYYHANRVWCQSGMDAVRRTAEWERVLSPELDAAISGFKFKKDNV